MILQMDLNTANDSLADFESRGRVTARAYEALDALRSDSAIITKIKAPGSLFCNINTLVEIQGLKPWTSALPGQRSNQLSYIPKIIFCIWVILTKCISLGKTSLYNPLFTDNVDYQRYKKYVNPKNSVVGPFCRLKW
jgi:hypothetical protein